MTLTFVVDAPIEAVYRYLSDLSLTSSDVAPGYTVTPPGQPAPGDLLTLDGPRLKAPWRIEVVSLTTPTSIAWRMYSSDHPERFGDLAYALEPAGTRTRVVGTMVTRLAARLELGMLLMKPFLLVAAPRGNRRLAAAIEARYRAGELN